MRSPGLIRYAAAKINLILRVRRRRPDGYHEIDSLMHRVDLFDRLTFTPAETLRVVTHRGEAPSGPANLAYTAARKLAEDCGLSAAGAHIEIHKRIPVAAGLAGGSADAAAALSGCNALWGCGRSSHQLALLAAELGADVPFCLLYGAARAQGVGEKLQPLPPWEGLPLVLIVPERPLSAAQVYQVWDTLSPSRPSWSSDPMVDALRAFLRRDLPRFVTLLGNDLEPAAVRLCPDIAAARQDLLSAGALAARMSGSGPAVFGIFPDPGTARIAAHALAEHWSRVYWTRLSSGGLARA